MLYLKKTSPSSGSGRTVKKRRQEKHKTNLNPVKNQKLFNTNKNHFYSLPQLLYKSNTTKI
jgi:hypothetical protein